MVQVSTLLVLFSWSLIGTTLASIGKFKYRLYKGDDKYVGLGEGYPKDILSSRYGSIIKNFYSDSSCKGWQRGYVPFVNKTGFLRHWEINCIGGECVKYRESFGDYQIYCTKGHERRYNDDYGDSDFAKGQGTEPLLANYWVEEEEAEEEEEEEEDY